MGARGGPPMVARGGPPMGASNRVYVGNLSWGVDDIALETLFSEQGRVVEAKVVYDRESGRSRGFGFVTYSSADEVNGAIKSLNGCGLLKICSRKLATAVFSCSWDSARLHLDVMVDLTASYTRKS
ncbi:hypothetical protein Golob_015476 [Gossypium lobatum]|uniref:RRM domain-containing protein n=1 Tax=Gossypium lobatum TaxID=34289 RepID=A0A7J8M1F5_9ROSI|nr:hypothetical protein [Gossypium lobatum]